MTNKEQYLLITGSSQMSPEASLYLFEVIYQILMIGE